MARYDYDLVVLEAGAAGLSLASIASRLGVKVALIDAGTFGGDCLHYGCVPSKTLIHAAKVAHMARTGEKNGSCISHSCGRKPASSWAVFIRKVFHTQNAQTHTPNIPIPQYTDRC